MVILHLTRLNKQPHTGLAVADLVSRGSFHRIVLNNILVSEGLTIVNKNTLTLLKKREPREKLCYVAEATGDKRKNASSKQAQT